MKNNINNSNQKISVDKIGDVYILNFLNFMQKDSVFIIKLNEKEFLDLTTTMASLSTIILLKNFDNN